MRKGFTVALLTVAVAILGSNAMSMAPVISNIKDIVVSDDAPVSGGNEFVYPDAIDLRTVVSDGDTTDGALVWSYSEASGTYLINGTPGLAIGVDDPVLPPNGKRIAGPGSNTDDTDAGSLNDTDRFTITVRNQALSPIGGTNIDGGAPGIIPAQTKALTFFVSDEDLTDSETILVYTEEDGTDRLSPAGGTEEYTADFTASTNQWAFAAQVGTVTSTPSPTGLCLTVPAAGDNIARWDSPYGLIQLADNTVYEIRLTMSTTQTTPLSIPFWDLSVINTNLNGAFNPAAGANAYGGDYFCLDNVGGAEGIGRNGNNEFTFYFVPPAVNFPGWRSVTTGVFQPGADDFNDFQFNFRVFDVASNGFGAQNDSGSICLQQIQVFSHDINALTTVGTVYQNSTMNATNTAAVTFGLTTFTFTNGDLTVAPSSATSWTDSLDFVRPGSGTDGNGGSPMPADSWPITNWQDDKLYLMSMEASIPSAASQTNGIPDLLYLVLEGGGQQTHQLTFVLPNIRMLGAPVGAGMPPIAPATDKYVGFGFSNVASVDPNWDAMRPQILIQNSPSLTSPQPSTTGSFTIHSWDVKEVTF